MLGFGLSQCTCVHGMSGVVKWTNAVKQAVRGPSNVLIASCSKAESLHSRNAHALSCECTVIYSLPAPQRSLPHRGATHPSPPLSVPPQALLSVVVAQQGDAIAARPALAARASRLRGLVAGGWARLDGLLQHVRCMVGFFGNLQ